MNKQFIGALAKLTNKGEGEINALLTKKSEEEGSDESVALEGKELSDAVLSIFKEKIKEVGETNLDRGLKKGKEFYEKALKSRAKIKSTNQGEDLIDEVFETIPKEKTVEVEVVKDNPSLSKLLDEFDLDSSKDLVSQINDKIKSEIDSSKTETKPLTIDDVPQDLVRKHPHFISTVDKYKKKEEKLIEKYDGIISEKETVISGIEKERNAKDIKSFLRSKYVQMNPKLSTNEEVKEDQINLVLSRFNLDSVAPVKNKYGKITNVKFVDGEGNELVDEFSNPIPADNFLNQYGRVFGFNKLDTDKSTPAPELKPPSSNNTPTTKKYDVKSEEDLVKLSYDKNVSKEDFEQARKEFEAAKA